MKRTAAISGTSRAPARTPAKQAARPPVTADFDTQLMLQVRAGSQDAANALMRRNFAWVSRYIARIIRNGACAEDLTQDVFLKVLKSASRYKPTAKFSTWLYRIATTTSLSYLAKERGKKDRGRHSDAEESEVPDRREVAPERQVSRDEMKARISAAIRSLPVKQHIAMTLFVNEQLSYEQIATILDTTVDGVRSLLKRGRERLRPKLGDLLQ